MQIVVINDTVAPLFIIKKKYYLKKWLIIQLKDQDHMGHLRSVYTTQDHREKKKKSMKKTEV